MAQPVAYVPATDMSGYQSANPTAGYSGALTDAELLALQATTDQIRANLALLQRDDGDLLNGLVTPFSLSAEALALIASASFTVAAASWATATVYPQYQLVRYDAGVAADGTYLSASAHTSGTFATDFAASKWILFALENGGVTLPLAVASGGTGSTTATDARTALGVPASPVVNATLEDMVQATVKGRAAAAGTGDPQDLTATQLATILNVVGGALKSKTVSFTRDQTAASGAVAVTGVGFVPTAILFLTTVAGATLVWCAGIVSSDTVGSCLRHNGGILTTATAPLLLSTDSDATSQTGQVASFDADGFTINWTKAGSPGAGTWTIKALCFR